MEQKNGGNKQRGTVNNFRVLPGAYLVYLAIRLMAKTPKSDTPVVNILAGLFFLVAGGLILLPEWKAYKYGVEHKDDPDSWSDEDVEVEAAVEELPEADDEDEDPDLAEEAEEDAE